MSTSLGDTWALGIMVCMPLVLAAMHYALRLHPTCRAWTALSTLEVSDETAWLCWSSYLLLGVAAFGAKTTAGMTLSPHVIVLVRCCCGCCWLDVEHPHSLLGML
jgi:hypothetical protein